MIKKPWNCAQPCYKRDQCPPLLVVFYTCPGHFLELMALTYLLFKIFYVHNSEYIVLRLNVAICVYAAGICVCATSLDILVLHVRWRGHTNVSGMHTKLLRVDSMDYTHIFI